MLSCVFIYNIFKNAYKYHAVCLWHSPFHGIAISVGSQREIKSICTANIETKTWGARHDVRKTLSSSYLSFISGQISCIIAGIIHISWTMITAIYSISTKTARSPQRTLSLTINGFCVFIPTQLGWRITPKIYTIGEKTQLRYINRLLSVFRHRFSAFWLRSKCSICSYQLNIWYVPHWGTSILNWFLILGEMSGACSALTTGWPGIAVPPGTAQLPIGSK